MGKAKIPLGQVLKVNREKLHLSLDDISEKTHIKKEYLICFETGIYDQIKDDIYTRQFLKRYAQVLGLSYEWLFELYFYEYKQYQKHHHMSYERNPHPLLFIFPHKWFLNVILIGVVLCIFSYLGYRFFLIVLPPPLFVTSPEQEQIITDRRSMEISGKTSPQAQVFINGKSILLQPDGTFSIFVDLREGINMIHISAKKKHGKEHVQTRYIIVE